MWHSKVLQSRWCWLRYKCFFKMAYIFPLRMLDLQNEPITIPIFCFKPWKMDRGNSILYVLCSQALHILLQHRKFCPFFCFFFLFKVEIDSFCSYVRLVLRNLTFLKRWEVRCECHFSIFFSIIVTTILLCSVNFKIISNQVVENSSTDIKTGNELHV